MGSTRACSFLAASWIVDPQEFHKANRLLVPRGPDLTSVHHTHGWTLAHNLLSLTGSWTPQPLFSSDGSFATLFNGEIYNYQELARSLGMVQVVSDGYVILPAYRAYGRRAMQHFRGEFAVVIIDYRTQTLTIASDVFSTKPLWYAVWSAETDSGMQQRIAVSTYESGIIGLGAPKSAVRMQPANRITVLSLDKSDPSKFGSTTSRLHVHRFDLQQYKTDTLDWEAAFERAVQTRAPPGRQVYVGLSSGYDSGAIALALGRSALNFTALSIMGSERVSVMHKRLRMPYVTPAVLNMSDATVAAEQTFLRGNCENFQFLPPHGESSVHNHEQPAALSYIARHARSLGAKIVLAGNGADEVMSDYGRGGKSLYPTVPNHCSICGHYPANLSAVFPWRNFYGGTQTTWLMSSEYTGGCSGLETRYPFLDTDVVQEFLWLAADVKNAKYKGPLSDYLQRHDYPVALSTKVGLHARAGKHNERDVPNITRSP